MLACMSTGPWDEDDLQTPVLNYGLATQRQGDPHTHTNARAHTHTHSYTHSQKESSIQAVVTLCSVLMKQHGDLARASSRLVLY